MENNKSFIVTKEYFYKKLNNTPGNVEFNKITGFKTLNGLKEITNFSDNEDLVMPYFETEKSGYLFVYFNSLDILLIPNNYNKEEVIEEIKNSRLTMDDWGLTKLSDKKKYIINTYLRGEHRSMDLDPIIEEGTYEIKNTRTNERFEVSIYICYKYSYYSNYIAYDDIAYDDDLIRTRDKFKKEQLFSLVFKNNGRDYYKKSNIESK